MKIVLQQVSRVVFCFYIIFQTGLGFAFSNPSGGDGDGALNITIMVPCNTSQAISADDYTAGIQASKSSNYCVFDGRYVTKGSWSLDTDDESDGSIKGKVIQAEASYNNARDSMQSKGYRLPTINELLRLVNFEITANSEIFSAYPIVNNWFKTSDTEFLDGYIISSTFTTAASDTPDANDGSATVESIMALDIRTRNVVKLDPLASYVTPENETPAVITNNSTIAPADRPLYVLGVADYFQLIHASDNQCLAIDKPADSGDAIKLSACDPSSIYQRWKLYDNRIYTQARGNTEFCVQMNDGTLASPSGDDGNANCTLLTSLAGINIEGVIIDRASQYFNINANGIGSTLGNVESEATQWLQQY